MSTPIERAIEAAGGVIAVSRALGVSAPAVSQWKKTGAPAERCVALEHATAGAVTRYELRPDVFGDPRDGALMREVG